MAVRRALCAGILIGLLLAACAGATFPYKYYGVDLVDSALLGPTPKDDLKFEVCAVTATDKSPCTAMMTDVFLAMKQDYLDKANQLNDCQHKLSQQ